MTYPSGGYPPPNVPDPRVPNHPDVANQFGPEHPGYVPAGPGQPPAFPGMTPPAPPTDIYLGTMPAGGPPAKRRSPVVISIVAAVGVLAVGAGAFAAADLLDSGGPAAATRLPGSATAFAAINLDVGAGQQLKLQDAASKFPELEDTGSPQELVDSVLDEIEGESDVKGALRDWVGLNAAVSLWMDKEDDPYAIMSVASRDDAAAKDGLAKIRDTAPEDDQLGFVVKDGFATIAVGEADSQAAAEAAADEAEKAPLSDAEGYDEAGDWLGEDQVLSAWADLEASKDYFQDVLGVVNPMSATTGSMLPSLFTGPGQEMTGQFALGATATDFGIEMRTRTFGADKVTPGSSDMVDRLSQLPPSDIAVVTLLPENLEDESMWGSFLGSDPAEMDEETSQVLTALSGSTLTLSVSDLATNPGGQVSVEATSADNASQIGDLATEMTMGEGDVSVDGNTVTAASPGYAAPDGELGADEMFKTATQNSLSEVSLAAYVTLDFAKEEPDYDEYKAIKALSFIQGVEDGQSAGVFRIMLE